MNYLSVAEISKMWGLSERSVRNYCGEGRIDGAVLIGKTWTIPHNAEKPIRKNKSKKHTDTLLEILKREKSSRLSGGIYHKLQIDLTYNSNRIEGSRLTHDETRYIFETNTIGLEDKIINVDDIVETANHFRCIDMVIDSARSTLTESFIKKLHLTLKNGTTDSRKEWFCVGDYKKHPNEVGGSVTTAPDMVATEMQQLLFEYNNKEQKTIEYIIAFHHAFEKIHPFQDGNGRVGRLIMLKECLKHNIVPFIIDESKKLYYYRGLSRFNEERGYLIDTCLAAQDEFKKVLDYFGVSYN